jgi:hypothetical protein
MGLITSIHISGFTPTVIALDINNVLGLLHRVIVNDVANISLLHASSVLKLEIYRLVCIF